MYRAPTALLLLRVILLVILIHQRARHLLVLVFRIPRLVYVSTAGARMDFSVRS